VPSLLSVSLSDHPNKSSNIEKDQHQRSGACNNTDTTSVHFQVDRTGVLNQVNTTGHEKLRQVLLFSAKIRIFVGQHRLFYLHNIIMNFLLSTNIDERVWFYYPCIILLWYCKPD